MVLGRKKDVAGNFTNREEQRKDSLLLVEAGGNGDLQTVMDLAAKGVNVNVRTPNHMLALIEAARGGYAEIVNVLLDMNADIEARDYHSEATALIIASIEGHVKVVKILLDRGAKINGRDMFGFTALMFAAMRNNREIVKLLLSYGANVNARNKNDRTALWFAKDRRRSEIVGILIRAGAVE